MTGPAPQLPACMGGWCAVRERCARYHAPPGQAPAERLCPADARPAFEPLSTGEPAVSAHQHTPETLK